MIEQVSHVLRGREDTLISSLKADMAVAAEALDFEKAAHIRDQLNAIEHTLQRQKVLSNDRVDQDVIAVVKDDRGAAIQMLYIRNGKLIGQHQYMLDGATDAAPGVAVQEFVKQYYSSAPEVPREILLPVEIEEINIIQAWLRQKKGSAVTLEVPAGGEKLRMVEMAANNAELALTAFRQELTARDEWADEAMVQLQEELGLSSPPLRIEGYDISNISGTAPVGSMVVTENGEAAKGEYRRFKIKFLQETPNDFAMMNEVIMRRLRNYLDGNEKFINLPDLIMIDGGKGQLGAALKARDDLGLTVPMIGLAKKQELIFTPTQKNLDGTYSYREIVLPMTSPGLMLLRKLRDEAHRFALTFHRKIRDKRLNGSVLDEVPGVGPRRRRMLLRTFGSIEAIRRASAEDIASVPTMTKQLASKVKEYLTDS